MKKFIIVLFVAIFGILATSCTETQKRGLKSIKSNWNGGLYRTVTLMDYEGDTLKQWSGKFDIRDEGSDNQIYFDFEDKRIWIQGGIVVSEEN